MSSTQVVRLLSLRTQKGAQADINAPQLLSIGFSAEISVDINADKDTNREADVVFYKIADFVFDPRGGDIHDMIKDVQTKHPAPSEEAKVELTVKIANLLRNLLSEMNVLFSGDEVQHGPSISEFIEVCCGNKTAICGVMKKVDGRFESRVLPYSNMTRLVPGAVQAYYKQQTLS